jgi:DNA modification methylase
MSVYSAALEVQTVPVDRVIPYARNPRKNESAVAKVAASIREFGFRQPIVVDPEMTVIAGHTRLLAARQLGLAEVPVHVAEGLSPAQIKAYRIADNRVAQEAEWDDELLALEFDDLRALDFDLSLTGFDAPEIAAMGGSGLKEGADPDDVPELPISPRSHIGDVFLLGRHRLICGDCQNPTVLARLMGEVRADVLWTDPPYGVSYVGKTGRALRIEGDGNDGLPSLLAAAFRAAYSQLAPSARFYCAAPPGPRGTDFRVALGEAGFQFHQALVWVKDALVLGHSDYHYRHEDMLYGYKPGPGRVGRGAHTGSRWYGDHSQTSVFEIPRPKRSIEHPTMKPTELIRRCLANSAEAGAAVLDIFAGSGTTCLAAEILAMTAYLVEIDPRYCDVIVQRWENATGNKAERVTAVAA